MFQATYRVSVALSLCMCILLNAKAVQAQIAPTTTATMSGSVSDGASKPVSGATVTLQGPKGALTHTDAHGLFVFVAILSSAEIAGFLECTSASLILHVKPVAVLPAVNGWMPKTYSQMIG